MSILIGVVVLGVVLVASQITFFRTLVLIAKVTPYEQKGDGTRSLLVLGDSTGYGTGASAQKHSIAGLIGTDYPSLTITNKSVNGRTIGELRKDIENLEGQYDVVLLQIGANDILQKKSLDSSLTDLNAVLDILEKRTRKIVMISSGNVGGAVRFKDEEARAYKEQSILFKEAFLNLSAQRPSFTYVDLYVAPEKDPFVLEPEIYTANDGLHPSDAGYREWYQKLKPALDTALGTIE